VKCSRELAIPVRRARLRPRRGDSGPEVAPSRPPAKRRSSHTALIYPRDVVGRSASVAAPRGGRFTRGGCLWSVAVQGALGTPLCRFALELRLRSRKDAVCAARRSAELGRCFVGCTHTVTLFLAAITASLGLISLMSADRGVPRLRVSASRGKGRRPGSGQKKSVISLTCSWLSSSMWVAPNRAIASGRRGGDRSDRPGVRWSGCRRLAGCSGVVGHRLPERAAAIRDRESTRLAYALPNCVPSVS
jgi:hypothetical protein